MSTKRTSSCRRRSTSRNRGRVEVSSDLLHRSEFAVRNVKQPSAWILCPFYGGSHKQLADLLVQAAEQHFPGQSRLFTLPGRKWHWRVLVSAAQFAADLPYGGTGSLFTTSMINLADLLVLRPDLMTRHKTLYFHENQLTYPSMLGQGTSKAQWSEYGWAQIMSCLAADEVLFNSQFNRDSFLNAARKMLAIIPTCSRPKNILPRIAERSRVLYYPITLLKAAPLITEETLHVVWAHRWESDKGSQRLLGLVQRLLDPDFNTSPLRFSILGEQSTNLPQEFNEIKRLFDQSGENITLCHFGYVEKKVYHETLQCADVAISTAFHEFFGVSMLEAVLSGCYPLCPNALVYPEFYPPECLYNTDNQLAKRVRDFARRPRRVRTKIGTLQEKMKLNRFSWCHLRKFYLEQLFRPIAHKWDRGRQMLAPLLVVFLFILMASRQHGYLVAT